MPMLVRLGARSSPLTIARWVLEGAYSRSLLAATLPSSYPPQAPRMACRRADPC